MAHPIINPTTLGRIFNEYGDSFQTLPLRDYLELGLKPRGSGDGTLNSHDETVIVRTKNNTMMVVPLSCINDNDTILGVNSWGNKFQTVEGVVQGYNPNNPSSGFERPILREGPHMVIGLYAFDQKGRLHLFRTLQMRNNRLIVDTPRGFAEMSMLDSGEQMYQADPEQVIKNLTRIVKEEVGLLQIKRTDFLGSDICNTSCIASLSALYSVEIDYESFIKFSGVISPDEASRRAKQLAHEGLIGKIFDLTVKEYLAYRKDPNIVKDMTADRISDFVVMTKT